jgi:hypothetical protein
MSSSTVNPTQHTHETAKNVWQEWHHCTSHHAQPIVSNHRFVVVIASRGRACGSPCWGSPCRPPMPRRNPQRLTFRDRLLPCHLNFTSIMWGEMCTCGCQLSVLLFSSLVKGSSPTVGGTPPPEHATLPIRPSIWNAPEVPPVSRHRHDSADPSVLTAWCLLGCGLATCLAIKYMPSITQHGASSGRSSCCSRPPSSKGAGPFLWPSMPWQKPAGSGGYQWRPISEGCHARLNPSDDIRPPSRRSPFAESCNLPHPQLHVR